MTITEVFAFVADDDGEGIVAAMVGGMWMPLVGGDPERVESLRELAQAIATETGRPITLARFTERTNVERIEP